MESFGFQHSQLQLQQIRLFHLQPGAFSDPISATLSVAHLGDSTCPKYEALSYVWGDPNVCFDITLDGHSFPVTINLWAALRRRRSADILASQLLAMLTVTDLVRGLYEERILWIDALCINQSDGLEKTYQVGLMTELYKNTWRGLAWLGEFEEVVALKPGMSLESYRDSSVTMDKSQAQMAFHFVDKLSRLSPDGHFTIETENTQPGWVSVTRQEVTAVQRLMSLDYWNRIWTAQEFVLPPRVQLVLGSIACEESFRLLASYPEKDLWKHHQLYGRCCEAVITNLPDFPAFLRSFFGQLIHLRRIRRELPMHLSHAISHFRHRHCADPRDKVFALLGLVDPEARHLVDYTLNKKQVYIRSIRYHIVSTNSLHPLMGLSERNRDISLPSWVPDLEAAGLDDPGRLMIRKEIRYIGECAPLFNAGTQRNMNLGDSGENELQLGGRRMDGIRRICKGPPQNLWENGGDSHLAPRLHAGWRNLLDTDPILDLRRYPSGGSYEEAFWRTCTCDVYVPRHLGSHSRPRRITTVEDEARAKDQLAHGAYGRGTNPATTFFISHQGYIGIGPQDSQVGDVVYVLFGGHVPFLLRELPEVQQGRGSHTFVGYSYVHGIMDGEVLEKDIPDEQVVIV